MTGQEDYARVERGFDWFEKTLTALNDASLRDTIYANNKEHALMRLRALRNEVLFLYHELGVNPP